VFLFVGVFGIFSNADVKVVKDKVDSRLYREIFSILKSLDLTPSQKEEIKGIINDFNQSVLNLLSQRRSISIECHKMLASKDFDEDKFMQMQENIAEINKEIYIQRAQTLLKILKTLDDRQIKIMRGKLSKLEKEIEELSE
jgi:Spy/CpxP family protein refolding chaperone